MQLPVAGIARNMSKPDFVALVDTFLRTDARLGVARRSGTVARTILVLASMNNRATCSH